MNFRSFPTLTVAAALLAASTGLAWAQSQDNDPHGNAPGLSSPAPSVDTGTAAPNKTPVRESTNPGNAAATGSLGSAANPPGNPVGTIDAGPKSAIGAGVSGRNPCYPGQSGQAVGSTNPAGMPSQCQ